MNKAFRVLPWLAVAGLGAIAFVVVSLSRGEKLSAAWILAAAGCTYALAYRFYSKWIATRVLVLNDRRATPCEVHEDGKDFVKTNRWIVFGHHFAAISGPGPLVGPVLAAQFGYLPGTLWILIGVVLAGAVQDFTILFFSIRRDGKSLGEMVREEISSFAGVISLLAIVSIIIILIAVLGLVVVKALAHSPWGAFTIGATRPIAMFMGIYLRYIRPGKVLEITVVGIALLLLAVWAGRFFHEVPALSRIMTLDGTTLAWAIIIYGLAASTLPVWLLLAPRDYLSTFMKLGTIGALAIGIVIAMPPLSLPPLTRFIDGTGPVFSGSIFPFCFITIACGAISGFHSLIASGTTPKMITRESHARPVGYGSMLLESAVAIMAMVAASTLDPGVYFAINSPAAVVGATPEVAVRSITEWGFPVTVDAMKTLAQDLGENTMFGRAGGAPTLAVGMAHIFSSLLGGKKLMAIWYHFAIMFEALFILTTVDAGTRVGRFLLQAFLGQVYKPLGNTSSYLANVFASTLLVGAWGYFMYQGVIDPLGGVNSLWPLFGIANQLLAVIALCLGTTLLLKMGRKKQLWVTFLPLVWVTAVTFCAAAEKIFHSDPKIGFLSAANALIAKIGTPALAGMSEAAARRTAFNLQLDAAVAGLYILLVSAVVASSIIRWVGLWSGKTPPDLHESETVLLPESALSPAAPSRWSWLSGATVVVVGLIRHLAGQQSVEPPHTDSGCSCSQGHVSDPGQLWAEQQERRFRQPKCC